MKRSVALFALLMILTSPAGALKVISLSEADWILLGNAVLSGDRIILTHAMPDQVSAAWFNRMIDVSRDFSVEFDVHFGSYVSGGEGMAFVLQSEGLAALGSGGDGVGYVGIWPSVAVKFDTNPGEQVYVMVNGRQISRTLFDLQKLGLMEDGGLHRVKIIWDADEKLLRVWVDGIKVIEYRVDIEEVLESRYAYVGWTGATGQGVNLQFVKIVELDLPTVEKAETVGQWNTVGTAYHYPVKMGFVLTPNEAFKAGAIWNKDSLDLRQPFSMIFRVYLGDHNGGDGLVFVLQSQSKNALGMPGRGLGYLGIAPSVAIKIDTDVGLDRHDKEDYIVLMINGRELDEYRTHLGEVEDERTHIFEVRWEPTSKTLSVYLDGELRIKAQVDLINVLDSPYVYFGWTAGTGLRTNLHYVVPLQLIYSSGGPVDEHGAYALWKTVGEAHVNENIRGVQLVEWPGDGLGAAWYGRLVNLSRDFKMTFYFGFDSGRAKAVYFLLQGVGPDVTSPEISPSYGVKIWVDDGEGYLGVVENGNVVEKFNVGKLYGDELHKLRVEWLADSRDLMVYLDEKRIFLKHVDLIDNLGEKAYFGFIGIGGSFFKQGKLEFMAIKPTPNVGTIFEEAIRAVERALNVRVRAEYRIASEWRVEGEEVFVNAKDLEEEWCGVDGGKAYVEIVRSVVRIALSERMHTPSDDLLDALAYRVMKEAGKVGSVNFSKLAECYISQMPMTPMWYRYYEGHLPSPRRPEGWRIEGGDVSGSFVVLKGGRAEYLETLRGFRLTLRTKLQEGESLRIRIGDVSVILGVPDGVIVEVNGSKAFIVPYPMDGDHVISIELSGSTIFISVDGIMLGDVSGITGDIRLSIEGRGAFGIVQFFAEAVITDTAPRIESHETETTSIETETAENAKTTGEGGAGICGPALLSTLALLPLLFRRR
ncbi:lectin-like domain-containing protein [Pyrococcus yayanosii]|uniref:Uncharacterized protein n=1 Tax=Pyrococcus yayanosii (strain CH1 / JCM 16557) TaxID=529709 RepID=F8AHS7_PYRYC|nr:CGP-CTERM sorting domain-containing protein [Pyrococcus yayanosii]AEH24210.1 hypothetical protein PYCH_05200 [Pyrococcus yayanosii CH1]